MEPRTLHGGMTYMAAKNWHLAGDAANKVKNALHCGDLVRPSKCEDCKRRPSRFNPIIGHHDDYAKPLELRWVCRECHRLIHYPHRLLKSGHQTGSQVILARAAILSIPEATV